MRPKHTKFRQVKKGPVKWGGNKRRRRWLRKHLPPLRNDLPIMTSDFRVYNSTWLPKTEWQTITTADLLAAIQKLRNELPLVRTWTCYTPSVEVLIDRLKEHGYEVEVEETPAGPTLLVPRMEVRIAKWLRDPIFLQFKPEKYLAKPVPLARDTLPSDVFPRAEKA